MYLIIFKNLPFFSIETFNYETLCKITNTEIPKDPKTGKNLDFPHVNKGGEWAHEQFEAQESELVQIYNKEVRENSIKYAVYFSVGLVGYFGVYKRFHEKIDGNVGKLVTGLISSIRK